MATVLRRRQQNIEGDFYVDSTCIDCDTCRWMAPQVFRRQMQKSAVYHQPSDEQERLSALQALLSCPTASIGVVNKPTDIQEAQKTFPIPIVDNVYHCGYHAEVSYGATSYFIKHPQGNILIDSPRFAPPLVRKIEEMGGITWLYLTHKDDVADHQKYRDHFGCQRILHQEEITEETKGIEHPIVGYHPIALTSDLLIIPTPGHTRGHTVLLYQNKYLFSGDHVNYSEENKQLRSSRTCCWYSWTKQIESMELLNSYSFEWILPGHGRRFQADSVTMKQEIEKCIQWMKTVS